MPHFIIHFSSEEFNLVEKKDTLGGSLANENIPIYLTWQVNKGTLGYSIKPVEMRKIIYVEVSN